MKKCKFVGFQVSVDEAFPKELIIKSLSKYDLNRKYKKRDQIFEFETKGDYIVGKILTAKPGSTRLLAKVEKLKQTRVDKLDDKDCEISINYCIWHVKTFYGLYAYYSGSFPFADFGNILGALIRQKTKTAKSGELKTACEKAKLGTIKELPRKVIDQINAKFAASFFPLVRREKMEQIVGQWKKLTGVSYKIATTQVDADQFEVLAPYTEGRIYEFRLNSEIKPKSFTRVINELIGWLQKKYSDAYKEAKLIGVDENDIKKRVSLGKFVDYFGEIELSKLEDENNNFEMPIKDSDVIQAMIQEANDRPDYFAKVK